MNLDSFLDIVRTVNTKPTLNLAALPSDDTLSHWRSMLRGASVDYVDYPVLQVTQAGEVEAFGLIADYVQFAPLTMMVNEVKAVGIGDQSYAYVITYEDKLGQFAALRESLRLVNALQPQSLVVYGYSYNRLARSSLLGLSHALHGVSFTFDKLAPIDYDLSVEIPE